MIEREYLAICARGHRSYLRLMTIEQQEYGRCKACSVTARLYLLPPPTTIRVCT